MTEAEGDKAPPGQSSFKVMLTAFMPYFSTSDSLPDISQIR